MTLERFRASCLAQPGATEQIQWRVDAVFKVGGTMFAVACTDFSDYPGVPVDEARPRLFERRSTGLWSVNVVTGAAPLLLARTDVSTCRFAYSADTLVCGTTRADGRTDVLVVDASTGASRRAAVVDVHVSLGPFGGPGLWFWMVPPGTALVLLAGGRAESTPRGSRSGNRRDIE